jgi:hypothetical protein
VHISAGKVSDRASNPNPLSDLLLLTVDTKAPSVAIEGPIGERTCGDFSVVLTWSEEVTNMAKSDIIVTGGQVCVLVCVWSATVSHT